MKKYLSVLKKSRLFAGAAEQEIELMLGCLQAAERRYAKGEYVFCEGDDVSSIMILAEGELLIQKDDYWGNRSIVGMVEKGEMFGEAYASAERETIMNDVIAAEDSTVIYFDIKKILNVCASSCRFHTLAVQNLFFTISEKNRKLVRKLGHISQRTTRGKLLSYLSEESKRQGSAVFTIPFDRQQLADFLSVDRSAMSAELSKMRADGLIKFERSRFTLL